MANSKEKTAKSETNTENKAKRGKPKAKGKPPVAVGTKRRVGRPDEYKPEYAKIARGMAKLGGTDFEIAQELGICTDTVWRWRSKFPEFSDALLEGKEAFDNRTERSLAQKAVGYSYHSEKVFQYEGQIIRAPIVEHVPPDTGAIKMWLGNRRPDKWKEKAEVAVTGDQAFLQLWAAISNGTVQSMLGGKES